MHPAPGQMASMQAFTLLHTPCVPPHCPPLTTVYAVPAAQHGTGVLAPCQAGEAAMHSRKAAGSTRTALCMKCRGEQARPGDQLLPLSAAVLQILLEQASEAVTAHREQLVPPSGPVLRQHCCMSCHSEQATVRQSAKVVLKRTLVAVHARVCTCSRR